MVTYARTHGQTDGRTGVNLKDPHGYAGGPTNKSDRLIKNTNKSG